MTNSKKKPLTNDERQAFIDNLAPDQINQNAEAIFNNAIELAALPRRSKPETPDFGGGYSDRQTRSRKTEGTSDLRSDTSRQ